jgi:hypothetical protein
MVIGAWISDRDCALGSCGTLSEREPSQDVLMGLYR